MSRNFPMAAPGFVAPELYKFAREIFEQILRHKLVEKFEHALKVRAWFRVGECKLRIGGIYIIRRVWIHGQEIREDGYLSPAIAQWNKSGWEVLAGGLEPERHTVSHLGTKSIQVLGKTPILYA